MRKNLHTGSNKGQTKQKREIPTHQGGLPGGAGVHAQETEFSAIQRGTHSRRNLSTRKDGANKRQKTQHEESPGNDDTRTTGVDNLPDGKDRANPTPESTPIYQITGSYTVETVISQGPRGPPLTNARQRRFWTVGDGPMFFPANFEGLHLDSYDAPVLRDVRRLAPFPEWSNPPLGGLGDDTGKRLWLLQDFVCIQHMGFDNTYDRTSRTLPTRHPIALRQQQPTQSDNSYKEAPCRSVPLGTIPPTVIQIQIDGTVETGGHILNQIWDGYESAQVSMSTPMTRNN